AYRTRACFFEGFHLSKPDKRRKLAAFLDEALRSGGPGLHGARDNTGCNFAEISCNSAENFSVCGHQLSRSAAHGHAVELNGRNADPDGDRLAVFAAGAHA